MNLQQKVIQKIEDYGGIDQLSNELERLRILASEKNWFDNMNFYLNSFYTQALDAEALALEFKQSSLEAIAYLEKFNKRIREPSIAFTIALVNDTLATVSGIRKIS